MALILKRADRSRISALRGKADMSLTIAIYQNPALGAFFHELAGGSLLKDQHKSFLGDSCE
jgi:hypothetical protein